MTNLIHQCTRIELGNHCLYPSNFFITRKIDFGKNNHICKFDLIYK